MSVLLQDLRYAVRMLARSPGLTAMLVLTLALGIGANTALFSVVNGVLLQPLQVPNPKQLVTLTFQAHDNARTQPPFSYLDYQDLRAGTTAAFSDTAAWTFGIDGVTSNGTTDRMFSNFVTGNFFSLLQLKPALGRLLLPSEGATPGADPVLVLGYTYWQHHFAGDAGVIGRTVDVDGHPMTIVGVAPRGFHGLAALADVQAYMPLAMGQMLEPSGFLPNFFTDRGQRALQPMARLAPGVTLESAQASARVLGERLAQAYPKSNQNLEIAVYRQAENRLGPGTRTFETISALFLMLAGLVLLLACVNVANLLLVRAGAREREMAVRAALGAGRARLMRQMLTESLLLALLGGAAGLGLGLLGARELAHFPLGTSFPILLEFGFDRRVFFYALAAAVFTGMVAGLAPALRASRANLNPMLQSGARVAGGRHWVRSGLVVAQVAGSLVLLVAAGLFVRSLTMAQRVNLGFDPAHIANFSVDPEELGYNTERGRAFDQALLERVRALPGVESAALAFATPLGLYNNGDTIEVPGHDTPPGQTPPNVTFDMVSPGYFSLMHIPRVSGRDFTDADTMDAPHVAIVNQGMAEKFWPGQDPIGRTFSLNSDKAHPLQVVGVVKNSITGDLFSPNTPYFYVASAQNYVAFTTLLVRATGPPESVMRPVEATIGTLAPGLEAYDVQSMVASMSSLGGFLMFRLGAILAGTLGLLGLALALVGVYGVISYSTAQRTHEIGIRMALGAQPGAVLLLIFRQGMLIVGAGVMAGLTLALVAGRAAGPFLLGISGHDPLTFLTVTAALAAAALAASYVPAWRATLLDPNRVLRQE